MSVHEQFAEELVLLALGELTGERRTSVEHHLQGCTDCREELMKLQSDLARLALSAPQVAPPARARTRLMDAVAREPRVAPRPKRTPWMLVPAFSAAVLLIAAALLWQQNARLRQKITGLQTDLTDRQAQLAEAKQIVATLTATDAMRVTLVAAKTPPQPQGKAIYLRDRSSLIFLASNLPALPPEKAYELWLIPQTGAPIPAGVFKPDARGSATVIEPPLPNRVEAKAFAITVEPETGSSAPTSAILMVGAGE